MMISFVPILPPTFSHSFKSGEDQGQGGEQSDVLEVQREQEAVPSPKRLKRYRNE